MKSIKSVIIIVILFSSAGNLLAQYDTTKYLWPYSPMTLQRSIAGTFGEYRSTSVEGHYHNAVDIPNSAGTPVLAVLPGVVAVAYNDGSTGYDSYVRVTSQINGQSKNITYYHTNPSVSVGQSVLLGQQVSTVAIDHVHLIEYKLGTSLSGAQINGIRENGGLLNYVDTWKPHIRYVKFLLDGSTTFLSPNALGSKVDIIAHIQEENGINSSAKNNGTYKIGYKIFSADTQTVVYNPPDNGIRYQYYNLPGNQYVNVNYYQPESNTSQHVYNITNGSGASNVMSTQAVSNNYWNVNNFPYGNYVVMIFTEDTRGNADTVFIPVTTTDIDLIPPQQPALDYVKRDDTNHFSFGWQTPPDADLKGYRLYYSLNGSTYQLRDNENVLNNTLNNFQYSYNQLQPLYLKLSAVDSAAIPNVSEQSDVYGVRMLNDDKKILIVDGFDRYGGTGSWSHPYHDFVISYGQSFDLSFESCSNDEIINGNFNLNDYQLVIWICGDESTVDETFSAVEIGKVKAFLENGGKLFVSGSEIAWDLEGESSATTSDKDFLHNYLKAQFVSDDSNIYGVLGSDSTAFAGLGFSYGIQGLGSPYIEDYPDIIQAYGGSTEILKYNGIAGAGVAYSGTFGSSAATGQVIYLSFPFETIGDVNARTQVMAASLNYFGMLNPNSIHYELYSTPTSYSLEQNYPNPFNPSTVIQYAVPVQSHVRLIIYDALGRKVAEPVNEVKQSGRYKVNFAANNLASGVYFYTIRAADFKATNKMILIR
ncbi:MAG: T9SS type A sorting domain-containing protein [Ignavibacteriaceae bacterium]|nr:T9SS type A sorting domain-containing protein [Ignavibacteriaceae bacterium]